MTRFKYLAIGDIFSDGPDLPERSAWPYLLAEELSRDGRDMAEPMVLAYRQETVAQILYAVQDANLPRDFDLVTIQVGAWDITSHPPTSLYGIAVADLLAEAIKLASGDGSRVVVVTPPLFGKVNDETYLEHFAEMIRHQFLAVMEQVHPHFVDLVEGSIELLFGDDPNRTENGFPNAIVHRAWAMEVARPARHILGPAQPPGPRLLRRDSGDSSEDKQD